MAEKFTDKHGRHIQFEEVSDTIKAYCIADGCKEHVGEISFLVSEYPDGVGDSRRIAYPEQMHIKDEYQRSGIATEIIECAKELYDVVMFYPDTGCGGNTDEIHYSDAGLSFKQFCETSGIINYASDNE